MNTTVQKIRTGCNEIWLDEEGILRVAALEEAEIDLAEAIACFDAYRQLGCDKIKTLQLIDAKDNMSITPEARNYASENGRHFFIASAVVNNSLAIRLIINFFNSFYNHSVPFKMFATEEGALTWLRNFR